MNEDQAVQILQTLLDSDDVKICKRIHNLAQQSLDVLSKKDQIKKSHSPKEISPMREGRKALNNPNDAECNTLKSEQQNNNNNKNDK